MTPSLKALLVGACFVALAGSANAAELVVNGGFNNGATVSAPGGGFQTVGTGSSAITGWNIIGGDLDWIKGYWQSADGDGFSVDMNGDSPGAIAQTINTVAGQAYTLTFAMSGNPDNFQGQTRVAIIGANGSSIGSANYSLSAGNSLGNMLWESRSFSFVADSATTQISFTSGNVGDNCCWGAAIDNVSVTGAVPEPATWAMMMSGLFGMGLALRGRRKASAAAATA
jgi:choice-of-anchor C domain-containing protein